MKNDPIQIRQAEPNDADTIIAFSKAMALETEGKTLDPMSVGAGVAAGLQDEDRSLYFVAKKNGRVAGQIMVTTEWSDWRNGFFWWIQSVYIAPEFRRQGIFRALHAHVRTLAKSHPDVCGLRLYVHRDNERAMKTYDQLGMARTEYVVCEEDWSEDRA